MSLEQRERVVAALASLVYSYLEREAEKRSQLKRKITEILNFGYSSVMEAKVIQVRGRGTLTLPSRVRARYALAEGDPMTLVDLDGVLVLSPKVGVVPKLAAEIERMRKEAGISLEELVEAQREQRKRRPRKT